MKTVVLGPVPGELQALIDHRKQLSIDTFDEVWEASYHVATAAPPSHGYVDRQLAVLLAPYAAAAGLIGTGPFNLGEPDDYRVPDGGYHRPLPDSVWVATAAIVVEVVSPHDETFDKFDFYAAHRVDEILVAEPDKRMVHCWCRRDGRFVEADSSELLKVSAAELTASITWP